VDSPCNHSRIKQFSCDGSQRNNDTILQLLPNSVVRISTIRRVNRMPTLAASVSMTVGRIRTALLQEPPLFWTHHPCEAGKWSHVKHLACKYNHRSPTLETGNIALGISGDLSSTVAADESNNTTRGHCLLEITIGNSMKVTLTEMGHSQGLKTRPPPFKGL
jgi:hypothetical protein